MLQTFAWKCCAMKNKRLHHPVVWGLCNLNDVPWRGCRGLLQADFVFFLINLLCRDFVLAQEPAET